MMHRYDPVISVAEFVAELGMRFGKDSICLSALGYLTKTMTAENGYVRYSGEDYFIHPIAVAKILMDMTDCDGETVSAALLHDCAEDIPGCTRELLAENFGESIADKVMLLTKTPGVDYHKGENMREYLSGILTDVSASLVKAADRMHNNSTMSMCTAEKRAAKTAETRGFYTGFCREAARRYPEYAAFFGVAERFFGEEID